MFSSRGLWRRVEPSSDLFQLAGVCQAAEVIARDAEPIKLFRAYDRLSTSKVEHALHGCLHTQTVPKPMHLSISVLFLGRRQSAKSQDSPLEYGKLGCGKA